MYKEIYVPVDNSDYSNQACVIGVDVARQFGGRVAGCHAYAAKMHDVRFRHPASGDPVVLRAPPTDDFVRHVESLRGR